MWVLSSFLSMLEEIKGVSGMQVVEGRGRFFSRSYILKKILCESSIGIVVRIKAPFFI
jgi:hypothetical protein